MLIFVTELIRVIVLPNACRNESVSEPTSYLNPKGGNQGVIWNTGCRLNLNSNNTHNSGG